MCAIAWKNDWRRGLEDCVDEIDAQRVSGYALYTDGKNTKLSYPLENFDSDVYGRSFKGNIDRARNDIEFMKNDGCCPNVFNYSALVDGLCKAGKPEDAKGVLAEMKNFGLKSDTVTYTSLINFFCRNGQIDEAIKLLKEMKENECEVDTVTFNVILGGLCREGRFDEALDMIEKLPHQGVYLNKGSYRIVLNSLTQKCELRKANKLLGLMLSRGFVPHYATSNELLVRLCKDGLAVYAATALFDLVDMGFQPQLDSWELLIELICRDRKLFFGLESQLPRGGVMEAIRISFAGFPTKKSFDEFVDRFRLLAPEALDRSSDEVTSCKRILNKAELF
ncbi:hypothetical protein KIW84_050232 [Lathyrus oleraceus]|uniref:Pentatricopeptide repeat-containing protein n=1 Tax=Pisum sativum TaxID=3888 RepID=A0A9D4WGW1_PEA|nr:hypothetical protein KIW84_050232 [Pisum sativum]